MHTVGCVRQVQLSLKNWPGIESPCACPAQYLKDSYVCLAQERLSELLSTYVSCDWLLTLLISIQNNVSRDEQNVLILNIYGLCRTFGLDIPKKLST